MAVPAIGGLQLTPRQKAAVIVRLVLAEGDDIDLARLPTGLQTDLAQEMALMGVIDRDTRNAIVAEFCDRLESVGLSFPGDIDGTLDLLGTHLSPDTTDRLRRMAAAGKAGGQQITTGRCFPVQHFTGTEDPRTSTQHGTGIKSFKTDATGSADRFINRTW